MKTGIRQKKGLFLLTFIFLEIFLYSKYHITIEGDYLLYSFDNNYIYGRSNIKLITDDFNVNGGRIEMDVDRRLAFISSECTIFHNNIQIKADVVEIDIEKLHLSYYLFEDRITKKTLIPSKKTFQVKSISFPSMKLKELKKSLLYFVGTKVAIKKNFDIFGFMVTAFVEGMHSISFKKFRMNKGITDTDSMFVLNKLWYYGSMGLVGDVSLNLNKKIKKRLFKSNSNLKVAYDIAEKKTYGSDWTIFFRSLNSLEFSNKNTMNLNMNHITENMSGVSLNYSSKISKTINTGFIIDYKKPHKLKEEAWLRSITSLNLKKFGILNLNLNYEKRKQYRGEITYNNSSIKNLAFAFSSSISNLLTREDLSNKLSTLNFSLKYSTKIFNLSADYSLNRDLIHDRSQSNPRIDFNISPFKLYKGLLSFNILSSLNLNYLKREDVRDNTYQANIAMDITSGNLNVYNSFGLNFSLRMEQFIDEDSENNYTSAGIILRGKQDIFNFGILELLYNYQSRRRTEAWFINGTASQDLSAVFRLKKKGGTVDMWTSVSFNSKTGEFTTGYFNFILNIIKNWRIQTLLNYDFEFDNFSYNLYLIRRAGRIAVRISYRSLSKKFLLEIIPSAK